jgi:hypothetical protein
MAADNGRQTYGPLADWSEILARGLAAAVLRSDHEPVVVHHGRRDDTCHSRRPIKTVLEPRRFSHVDCDHFQHEEPTAVRRQACRFCPTSIESTEAG